MVSNIKRKTQQKAKKNVQISFTLIPILYKLLREFYFKGALIFTTSRNPQVNPFYKKGRRGPFDLVSYDNKCSLCKKKKKKGNWRQNRTTCSSFLSAS